MARCFDALAPDPRQHTIMIRPEARAALHRRLQTGINQHMIYRQRIALDEQRREDRPRNLRIGRPCDPARRTQHYTDIAAAVEENLVILRSA